MADPPDPLPVNAPLQEPPEPVEVRHEKGAGRLVVEWSDAHVSPFSLDYLRSWCPCAGCQGHDPVTRFLGLENQQLARVEGIGNYALGLTWADGHDTGIYSFKWLRRICPCDACGGGKRSEPQA